MTPTLLTRDVQGAKFRHGFLDQRILAVELESSKGSSITLPSNMMFLESKNLPFHAPGL
jgi:hypothetical protein